jgi:N-methylhydantoinase A
MHHVGVDTGGTFTDTVLIDDDEVQTVKTLTTDDLIGGIVDGFESICDRAGLDPGEVDSFNHGSTVAVNALIEKTGARTALVTTEGFEDVLEIGEGFRDRSLLYAPCGDHTPPLVPRKHRYGVTERVTADGSVETPLDEDGLETLIADLRDEEFDSVAVSLLHAYENADHERAVVETIADRASELDVSRSSAVSPEIREYSRTSTTVADAYIKPRVTSYIETLESTLRDTGYDGPMAIMNSSGGVAGPSVATSRPVTQILSGPVAGVQAAQFVGERIGIENLITLDMGGTSCDTTLIEGGDPVEVPHRYEQGMKINGPFVNIETVGAGGGSIAWLDEVDALRVGPESAGSEPGPVCYGFGGERPTVTDADLQLGILNPENFAGGEIELDADAARAALDDHVADPLGMTTTEAAVAIRDVTDGNMASALRVVSVKQGYDPREFALMGFGGAGPMHACNVAAEMGIDTVVFPDNPGLLSALGLVVSDFEHEYVQSLVVTADEADPASVEAAVADLVDRGESELDAEGVDPSDRSFDVSIDVRYTGQSHYLNVGLDGRSVTESALSTLADRFETAHEDRFGFVDDVHPVELVNVRVTARGETENPELAPGDPATEHVSAARRGTRPVVVDVEEVVETPYYDGEALGPGHELAGPAVVELENSTVWIPPAFDARIDEYANLIATRGEGQ